MTNRNRRQSFAAFYPQYLKEHQHPVCRLLHYIGTWGGAVTIALSLGLHQYRMLMLTPVVVYSCAWVGHFVFEKNRPTTFKQPWYSFLGDCLMWLQLNTGHLRFRSNTGVSSR